MKKLIVLFTLLAWGILAQTGPWQAPLLIRTSTNGTTFGTSSMFQDSSGVPTVIRMGTPSSDTLIAAFQWFPAPKFSTYWDKIAVKFSYNGGATWTAPKSCTFIGVPMGFQRPFDPSIMQLSNGQIRMYFSDGPNVPPAGGIDSYSALSNDGITYTVEPGVRFNDATKHAIDPSVVNFGGTCFYTSWTSNQTDGSFRAISNNGITFTTQPTYTFDGLHLWLGNYLVDGSTLKFYGSGTPGNIWYNTSTNGVTWSGYVNTNVSSGADPSVVKNKAGTYVMVYTGPPTLTNVDETNSSSAIKIFPSIFSHHINIKNESSESLTISITDVSGKIVYEGKTEKGDDIIKVTLSHLNNGIYICRVAGENTTILRKLIKTD